MNLQSLKWSMFNDEVVRQKVYWLGPYREATTMSGHGIMVFADKIRRNGRTTTRDGSGDGWEVVACAVNWEDSELTCDHSGERIESAYAD